MTKKILNAVAITLFIIVCVLGYNVLKVEGDEQEVQEKTAQQQVPQVLVITTKPKNNNGTIKVYDSCLGEVFSGEGEITIINDGRNGELIEIEMYIVRKECTECKGGENNVNQD